VLRSGGVAVIPTDTVYGLAASLDHPEAIDRIFELKRRPRDKPLAVLVANRDAAATLANFTDQAAKMAGEGWPGPLTLVLESTRPLKMLGGDGLTVGIRVPNHPFTLELLDLCGPLATTSANPSGVETPCFLSEIIEQLGDGVDLYVDALGGSLSGTPSRIVSVVGEPKTLR
jgi:L-threonylcarbamoyladenylate synthase